MVKSQNRGLMEAAMVTTVTMIMILLMEFHPLFFLLVFIWFVPLIALVARWGLRYGLMSAVGTCLLLVVLGWYTIIPPLIPAMIMGLCLGLGLYKDWVPWKLWGLVTILGTIALVISLIASLKALGFNFVYLLHYDVQQMAAGVVDLIKKYLGENTLLVQFYSELYWQQIVYTLPVLMVLGTLFQAACGYHMALVFLKRLGFRRYNTMVKFSQWKLPILFAYMFAFGVLGIYWGRELHLSWLTMVGMNLQYLGTIGGFVQAVSLLAYLKEIGKISKKMFIIIIICSTSELVSGMLTMVGYFDMIFDYRKKIEEKGNKI